MAITEERVHAAVCRYISLKYPDVIYTSDLSGVILNWKSAKAAAKVRSSDGIPDLIIFEPRGGYHGLFIELKKDGERLYLKDGSISKDKHIQKQKKILDRLTKKGYFAVFGPGLNTCMEIVDNYMRLPVK